MIKEELEKEAEKYALSHFNDTTNNHECIDDYAKIKQAYLASAEPREKQIEIDAEQIRALQKQNGELTDKVKELESQIEKMKCCGNCKYCGTPCTHPSDEMCEDLDKWELAD